MVFRQVLNSFRAKNIQGMKFFQHNPRATFCSQKCQSHKCVSTKCSFFTTIFSHYFITISQPFRSAEREKEKKRRFDVFVMCLMFPLHFLPSVPQICRHVANIGLQQQTFEGHDFGISWNTCLFVVKKVLRCLSDSGPQQFQRTNKNEQPSPHFPRCLGK